MGNTFTIKKDIETNQEYFVEHIGFFKSKIVDNERFFCSRRDEMKETDYYGILPKMEDRSQVIDTITYLYNKSILSRQNNWESDFGYRVKVKAEFIKNEENYERSRKDYYFMPRTLFLRVRIFQESTGKDIFNDFFTLRVCYSDDHFDYWNYSEDYIALLIQNAINGNLQTARDIEKTMLKYNEDIYMEEGWPIFKCDECGEKFLNLNDFYCHLLEEGHYDSFLDEFPNDRETLHVKNMLERKGITKRNA